MTDRDKMIEKLAKAIYCHKGDLPAPWDNVGDGWDGNWSELRMEAVSQAAAVLELVGPKPLVWHRGSSTTTNARYTIAQSDYDDGFGEIWYILIDGKTAGKFGQFSTEEAAQAAAQEHADAAHWVNTKIGGQR